MNFRVKSKWSKYKYVKQTVEKYVTQEDSVNNDDFIGMLCNDNSSPHRPNELKSSSEPRCELSSSNLEPIEFDWEGSVSSIDDALSEALSDCSSIISDISSFSDVSESDDDSEHGSATTHCDLTNSYSISSLANNNLTIRDQLAVWAMKFSVNHVSLNGLLKILSRHHPELPTDARALLKTKNKHKIDKMEDMQETGKGEFVYFGLEEGIKANLTEFLIENNLDSLELLFNIDGLPLWKSSTIQFWPILCAAVENHAITNPFIVGIFCGVGKPKSVQTYLARLVEELKLLTARGLSVYNDIVINVTVKGFICDAPARAFVKCIMGHNAFHGCEKCLVKGTRVENRTVFLDSNAPRRTDSSFVEYMHKEHHKLDLHNKPIKSPLVDLNMGLVSQIPLECMHLIYLGVMKKLLGHWLRGDKTVKISQKLANEVSDAINNNYKNVCSEFARKPRSLKDVERWKAVEYRLFVCYLGPVVLKGILREDLYNHFLLLHVAVVLLSNSVTCFKYCDYAESLLKQFVDELPKLYGKSSVVYCMHSLVHVCEDVRRFGPIESYSAFPFENKLGQLKRMLRTGKTPLQQICCRLSEQSSIEMITKSDHTYMQLAGPYWHYSGGIRFKKLLFSNYQFNVDKEADKFAVMDDGSVIQVLYFSKTPNAEILVHGNKITQHSNFFCYPCNSEMVSVFQLDKISEDCMLFSASKIVGKSMVLQRRNHRVAFLLSHTID